MLITSGTMLSVSATVMGPRAKSTSSLPDLVIEVDYISFLSAAIPNASRTPKVEKMCKSIYPNSPLCDVDLGILIAGVSASPSQWIKFGKRTAASLTNGKATEAQSPALKKARTTRSAATQKNGEYT